jgi:drug/metabolite transporter (DMT)-like permease
MNPRDAIAIACLLVGAVTWGVIWYPFRALEAAGMGSALSTLVAYAFAVALGIAIAPRAAAELARNARAMLPIAVFAGLANIGFLIAVTGAEVVRVVLLFYLAPVWTAPLAWVLLDERMTPKGFAVIAIALAGAAVMLWRPELGAPMPKNGYEWIGLSAGVFFAVANVLVRRAQAWSAEAKGLASCVGVLVIALPVALAMHSPAAAWPGLAMENLGLLATIGIALLAMTFAMQHGLSHVAANRAAVILLSEIVVAALAAYLLAGERIGLGEAIGGALIVAAGLVSAFEGRGAQVTNKDEKV